jgi:hypothetical protein
LNDKQLCVTQFDILAIKEVFGDFNANGILGFAPSNNDKSFIKALKDQGQIKKAIVSFNY